MLTVTHIRQTCGACPAQWEGETADGRMVYVRYRYGWLSVRVSAQPTTNVMDAVSGDEIFGKDVGVGPWDGYMDYEELRGFVRDVLVLP